MTYVIYDCREGKMREKLLQQIIHAYFKQNGYNPVLDGASVKFHSKDNRFKAFISVRDNKISSFVQPMIGIEHLLKVDTGIHEVNIDSLSSAKEPDFIKNTVKNYLEYFKLYFDGVSVLANDVIFSDEQQSILDKLKQDGFTVDLVTYSAPTGHMAIVSKGGVQYAIGLRALYAPIYLVKDDGRCVPVVDHYDIRIILAEEERYNKLVNVETTLNDKDMLAKYAASGKIPVNSRWLNNRHTMVDHSERYERLLSDNKNQYLPSALNKEARAFIAQTLITEILARAKPFVDGVVIDVQPDKIRVGFDDKGINISHHIFFNIFDSRESGSLEIIRSFPVVISNQMNDDDKKVIEGVISDYIGHLGKLRVENSRLKDFFFMQDCDDRVFEAFDVPETVSYLVLDENARFEILSFSAHDSFFDKEVRIIGGRGHSSPMIKGPNSYSFIYDNSYMNTRQQEIDTKILKDMADEMKRGV